MSNEVQTSNSIPRPSVVLRLSLPLFGDSRDGGDQRQDLVADTVDVAVRIDTSQVPPPSHNGSESRSASWLPRPPTSQGRNAEDARRPRCPCAHRGTGIRGTRGMGVSEGRKGHVGPSRRTCHGHRDRGGDSSRCRWSRDCVDGAPGVSRRARERRARARPTRLGDGRRGRQGHPDGRTGGEAGRARVRRVPRRGASTHLRMAERSSPKGSMADAGSVGARADGKSGPRAKSS